MVIICIVCTIIYLIKNLISKNKPKADGNYQPLMHRINDCFAIIPNIKAIFDCSDKIRNLSAIDGIRAILCFWMFVQNQYETGFLPFHTKRYRESAPYKFHDHYRYILFTNWNLIDTFFLLGGMTCFSSYSLIF